MSKTCAWCEDKFEPNIHNQIYCGPKCEQAARRKRNEGKMEKYRKMKRESDARIKAKKESYGTYGYPGIPYLEGPKNFFGGCC